LLSNCTCAAVEVSASPKFVPGALTQLCTAAVTSNVTYSPADPTGSASNAAPIAGSVA
jgi:hypothetical protein